jgi:hypothetical protein
MLKTLPVELIAYVANRMRLAQYLEELPVIINALQAAQLVPIQLFTHVIHAQQITCTGLKLKDAIQVAPQGMKNLL